MRHSLRIIKGYTAPEVLHWKHGHSKKDNSGLVLAAVPGEATKHYHLPAPLSHLKYEMN
jgi:hypothetical protein